MTITVAVRSGAATPAVDRRLDRWTTDGFAERLWDKDATLWFDPPRNEIANRLGWLDLAAPEEARLAPIRALAAAAVAEGVTDVVLLGMGGSSLAPDVYRSVFGSAADHPRLTVLDSTHPGAVDAVASAVDPATTLFIVSSKSGTTLETMSFFHLMWDRVAEVVAAPGGRFIAITDPGSALEEKATERGFREVFLAPADVGGRFSALSEFGLVPAALIGVDIDRLLIGTAAAAEACGPNVPVEENPALQVGAALGELALTGRDKVVFLAGHPLEAFPIWVEQLIAESLGKDGTGIVPVAGGFADPMVHTDRVPFTIGIGDIATRWVPGIDMSLDDVYDLGGAMFVLEMATAAAGAVLGVHPFDQPNVQAAKEMARTAMAEGPDGLDTVRWNLDGDLEARLRNFLGGAGPGAYVAVQAYLPPTPDTEEQLTALHDVLEGATGAAVTVGFGPRFLHSTGQLHKGGPASGIFLQIVDQPEIDLAVPETDFSFGRLIAGQADGDQSALRQEGRPVAMIDLGADGASGLRRLRTATEAATA
jgi:transaldolase/glucose-6-phosphate isomerase